MSALGPRITTESASKIVASARGVGDSIMSHAIRELSPYDRQDVSALQRTSRAAVGDFSIDFQSDPFLATAGARATNRRPLSCRRLCKNGLRSGASFVMQCRFCTCRHADVCVRTEAHRVISCEMWTRQIWKRREFHGTAGRQSGVALI